MTFGIGSPGFDPFYCPPCPENMMCNTICIDPLDFIILMIGIFVIVSTFYVLAHMARTVRFRQAAIKEEVSNE